MKAKPLFPFIMLLLIFPPIVRADIFAFKHKVGDKYRFISTTRQELFYNDKRIQVSNLVDRMASEVRSIENGIALHNATFELAEEIVQSNSARRLQWGNETYTSVFGRDSQGNITIDKKYFMPSVRNVPCFPKEDIQPGYIWKSQGSEVLDLRSVFNVPLPYEVPFTANNKYMGEVTRNNKKYKAFMISFTFAKRENIDGFENAPRTYLRDKKAAQKERSISAVRGSSNQTIFWDEERGNIAAAEDTFELRFELTTGEVYVFKGKTTAEMIVAETLNKEKVARDVEKDLHDLGVKDAEVKVVDEGISISLENIQFAADSSVLLPSEKAKLEKISAVLRKYNERDIMVSGHTAAAGNAKNRQPLSEERAAAVASYFIQNKVRPASRIITRGFGSSRPVASNTTEEGRAKNRRVEITILEN